MNNLYIPVLVVHVLVAVLGLGTVASIAVAAGTARSRGRGATEVLPWLGSLLRYSAFSLAAMLVTGILLDLVMRGAFRERWWFRGSALLLIATGALHAQARRAVRAGLTQDDGGELALRRVERMAYGMCTLIAAITILMEVKPF